jgi:7-dehydrocholesterol reductase
VTVPEFTNLNIWGALFAFMFFQVLLMKLVPGKAIEGPLTMQGFTPQYIDNGFYCYLFTLLVFFLGIKFDIWNGGILIDNCGPVIIRLNIFALVFCFFLLYKGYKNPSTKDTKYSGDFFSDYFWGSELYPRLCFDTDIKVWTNCRMGMTMWPLIILSCWFY